MIIITIIAVFILIVVFSVLSLCFHVAGGVLKLALKLLVCLPAALLISAVGVALCCTLLLIPLGFCCFKLAGSLMNPFHA
ncbi:MAG: hypothetical protein HDR23_09185 [Lachnospiraceae bacterium]|nr:hypothetical protein [Lachnospiraceae bacterium]MBD5456616.1 hypothetical protein [Lachnospiraceae bacterium]